MTVYVDDAQIPGPTVSGLPKTRMRMCHMTADTYDQLMEMARAIGVNAKHFQNTDKPHFDVCRDKRDKAVELGAALVDSKTIVRVAKRLRKRMGEP